VLLTSVFYDVYSWLPACLRSLTAVLRMQLCENRHASFILYSNKYMFLIIHTLHCTVYVVSFSRTVLFEISVCKNGVVRLPSALGSIGTTYQSKAERWLVNTIQSSIRDVAATFRCSIRILQMASIRYHNDGLTTLKCTKTIVSRKGWSRAVSIVAAATFQARHCLHQHVAGDSPPHFPCVFIHTLSYSRTHILSHLDTVFTFSVDSHPTTSFALSRLASPRAPGPAPPAPPAAPCSPRARCPTFPATRRRRA